MGLVNPTLPTSGDPRGPEELDLLAALQTILAEFNGNIDLANLSSALQSQFGLTSRGKCIVATEESRSSASYGTLTTPDQVSDVVLPADGLIFVAYQALWKYSAGGSPAQAAIFLGANQLKVQELNSTAPATQAATCQGSNNTYTALSTGAHGLVGKGGSSYLNPSGNDVTTGQLVGVARDQSDPYAYDSGYGACIIFAAAGTYDVSVRFLAPTGSVTAKNRKLWVWTEGF